MATVRPSVFRAASAVLNLTHQPHGTSDAAFASLRTPTSTMTSGWWLWITRGACQQQAQGRFSRQQLSQWSNNPRGPSRERKGSPTSAARTGWKGSRRRRSHSDDPGRL